MARPLKFTEVSFEVVNNSYFIILVLGKLSKDFQTPANGPVVLDESQQVAVKILKKNVTETQKAEFLSEVEINKLIGRHSRIINLIGKLLCLNKNQ